MAGVRGTKPKEGGKLGHTPQAHAWVQVPDRPFTGRVPVRLPAKRLLDGEWVPVLALTKGWWSVVRAMPHCRLWSASDWQFALATALVADLAFRGSNPAAAELRQRERVLGTTLDARRDLRIRYVRDGAEADEESKPAPAGAGAPVANLADRRRRLADA